MTGPRNRAGIAALSKFIIIFRPESGKKGLAVHLARANKGVLMTEIHYRKGTGHTDLLAFAAFSIVDLDFGFLPLG